MPFKKKRERKQHLRGVGFVLKLNCNTRKAWSVLRKTERAVAGTCVCLLAVRSQKDSAGTRFPPACPHPSAHTEAPAGRLTRVWRRVRVSTGCAFHPQLHPCCARGPCFCQRATVSPLRSPQLLNVLSASQSSVFFFLVTFCKRYFNSANVICCLKMGKSCLWGEAK